MLRLNAVFLLLLPAFAQSAEEWPYPEDTPPTSPVTVGLAGEQPADIVRYLLAEGATAAKLSPDGETVAFRWAVSGEPQLWLVAADGGFPRQLTFGGSVTFFEWTPDGAHLLVARDANGNEREGYNLLSLDGTSERQILPQTTAFRSFGAFSPDGNRFTYSSTERNGLDYDIYVANLETASTRLVHQGSYQFNVAGWQPDGSLLIVTEDRGEDAHDVHLLDIDSGDFKTLFKPDVAAAHTNFEWLPDGSGFYMATNVDREFTGLARYSLQTDTLEYIETPDADISNVDLSLDGRVLSWVTNEDGYSRLHALDLETNEALDTPELQDGVYTLNAAKVAGKTAIRVSGPATPGDIIVWDLASGETTRPFVSSLGGLDPDSFVAPESLTYPARDGVELQGFLYLPKNAAQLDTPPVVVQVHGGPTAQSRPTFRPIEQYLVNNGIAVFAVNVRGSTGFGKTYSRLDNQEKRLDSVRDLVDTVAFLSRDERLDTNRIAVMGGSYGGYMVNAVLGSYPGVFDAGVSAVGVSDWVRALQEAGPSLKASDRVEYGDIREDRWQKFYAKNSPINNVDKINVPLLVTHGVNDPRDPVTESDRIVEAVRGNGHEVVYFRFPDEGHSIRQRSNRVAYYRALSGFLEDQLKPENRDVGD